MQHEAKSDVFKKWTPKGLIKQVIQACCTQLYKDNEIEQIFYNRRDINGFLILHLGTKFQTHLSLK